MKILVTGGTGLIGGHLVPRLQELGHQVTVLTRRPDDARKNSMIGSYCGTHWKISTTSTVSMR